MTTDANRVRFTPRSPTPPLGGSDAVILAIVIMFVVRGCVAYGVDIVGWVSR